MCNQNTWHLWPIQSILLPFQCIFPHHTPVMQMLLPSLYRWGNWRTLLTNGRPSLDHKYLPSHMAVCFFSVGAVTDCLNSQDWLTNTEKGWGRWSRTSQRGAHVKGVWTGTGKEASVSPQCQDLATPNVPLILGPQKTQGQRVTHSR